MNSYFYTFIILEYVVQNYLENENMGILIL